MTTPHRLDDPRHPARHDTDRPTSDRALWTAFRRWWDRQERADQDRFCCHGSYTGLNGSMSFLCPLCEELGFSPMRESSTFVAHDWFTEQRPEQFQG